MPRWLSGVALVVSFSLGVRASAVGPQCPGHGGIVTAKVTITSEGRWERKVCCEGLLTRNAPAATTSYGPRRVLYPQLVGLAAGTARFGPDPALFRGCCPADEIVDFAAECALAELGPRA